ncbi:hypothetical protein VNO80_06404 [Phaseolus coccineus]|uniref:Uncharacterized protein n=1 Tax=Phaseolus coccineus TaxID=3886 RepID=A0AAN9REH0_PHACN
MQKKLETVTYTASLPNLQAPSVAHTLICYLQKKFNKLLEKTRTPLDAIVSDAPLAFATQPASKMSTDAKPKHGFNQVSDSNADKTVKLIVILFQL